MRYLKENHVKTTFILRIQGCLNTGKKKYTDIIHCITKLKEMNYDSFTHTNTYWVPTFFLGAEETTLTRIKILP